MEDSEKCPTDDFQEGESKLRDHFAGLAMQGLIANQGFDAPKNIADASYEIAEAMLKARKEVKP